MRPETGVTQSQTKGCLQPPEAGTDERGPRSPWRGHVPAHAGVSDSGPPEPLADQLLWFSAIKCAATIVAAPGYHTVPLRKGPMARSLTITACTGPLPRAFC